MVAFATGTGNQRNQGVCGSNSPDQDKKERRAIKTAAGVIMLAVGLVALCFGASPLAVEECRAAVMAVGVALIGSGSAIMWLAGMKEK